KQIVKEPVLAVPHRIVSGANPVHRIRNPNEVLEEPEGHFLVHGVVLRKDQRDLQHVLAVKRHPGRTVSLVKVTTGGQFRTAIENADVIEPQESSSEYI